MNKIQLSEKTGFPNCWESMTEREVVYLIKLWMMLVHRRDLSMNDIRRQFVSQVFTWRGIRKEKTIDYMLLVNQVADTLDWAISFNEQSAQVVINYDCIVCQIPRFADLQGPQNYGGDLSFGEFKYLLAVFNAIGKGEDVERNLSLMGAVLYRRRDKKTGRRILFREAEVSTGKMRKLPEHITYYAYLWFAAFCKYLMDGPFIIGGHEVNFKCIFTPTEEDSDNSLGMDSILFSIAESHVFGNIKDVEDAQLFRVLLKLVDDKNKSDDMKKLLKK